MNKYPTPIVLVLFAVLAACGSVSTEAPPPNLDSIVEAFEAAPACEGIAEMSSEIPVTGCLSGGTLYAFADFGCGAYSDHGGGLYGDPYLAGATFEGCD